MGTRPVITGTSSTINIGLCSPRPGRPKGKERCMTEPQTSASGDKPEEPSTRYFDTVEELVAAIQAADTLDITFDAASRNALDEESEGSFPNGEFSTTMQYSSRCIDHISSGKGSRRETWYSLKSRPRSSEEGVLLPRPSPRPLTSAKQAGAQGPAFPDQLGGEDKEGTATKLPQEARPRRSFPSPHSRSSRRVPLASESCPRV